MMDAYDSNYNTLFLHEKKVVESGDHLLPVDPASKLKLQLARLVGMAPETSAVL